MSYRRVTYQDRLVIKASLDASLSKTKIADKLEFYKSTISREIKRNMGGRGYQTSTKESRRKGRLKNGPYKMNPIIMTQIIERLEAKWSPEQISNRLKLEGEPRVSTETIYKFINEARQMGGPLCRHLRRSGRRRKSRFPSVDRRDRIKDDRPLSCRPKAAEKRKTLGHWERDPMVGKNHKSSVLVITDRKSRFNKFRKLYGKYSKEVTKDTISALKCLPKGSMSNNRGLEFSDHKGYEKKIKVKVFFCDPYSNYQRETKENRLVF